MSLAVLSSLIRPLIEPHLPPEIEPRWFTSVEELHVLAPEAQIGWFDLNDPKPMIEAVRRADKLEWLNSIYAGLDFLPLDLLAQRGVAVTNGAGINAVTIAEYIVMAMLNVAKNYRSVLRAAERREWLADSPGKRELAGSRALLLGYGAIGKLVKPRLEALKVDVTVVRRTAGPNTLGPDEWRARLGEFDWVICVVPATPETEGLIGAAELAAMKDDAVLLNFARGSVVDQPALVEALQAGTIGHAWLDVTEPEPLPGDHPLWTLPNAQLSMHLSGRAQTQMFQRSAARFVENCKRWVAGEPVEPRFDLERGY